ncbi:MAG TPA: ABC transporter ATP-binding protein [Anaerolineae bacterium]|nr:ABC transporter ATP-binding protein [Anaerolineae bacterium]
MIETYDLSKDFDDLVAVDGVSLRVQSGEILALLGPNGAGKTTTIRMLASILRPSRGRATVAGYDVLDQADDVHRCIGLLTEHHGLYTRMRAREYLSFFGRVHALPEDYLKNQIDTLLQSYGLSAHADRRLGEYSRGMRQKLVLVRSLLHDPPVLLLDEPTSAMDPASARMVRQRIVELRSSKRAVVVCTHNLHEAEELADRIAIIREGRIVALGSPSELKNNLLGDAIMELRMACRVDGMMDHLPAEVRVVEVGEDWLRYRAADPETDNPLVLQQLMAAGFPVVTLTEVGRDLEEVYLRVVGEEMQSQEAGDG